MLTAKKKITVREAGRKQQSVNLWYRMQDFYEKYPKHILGGAGILAALILFSYVYFQGRKADELEASRLLRIVQPLYQQQQYKLAISGDPAQGVQGLEHIASMYDGTPSGELAQVFLGNSYLYTDEYDKALAAFQDASPEGGLMESAALVGQAAAYEAKKEFEQAAQLYEKAAKVFPNDLLSADRYFHAGRMYCMAGMKEKAVEAFRNAKDMETPRYERDIERLVAQYDLQL